MPSSRERVAAAHAGVDRPNKLYVRVDIQQDIAAQRGDDWWMECARILTGLSDKEIDSLGGVRINIGENNIIFEKPALANS